MKSSYVLITFTLIQLLGVSQCFSPSRTRSYHFSEGTKEIVSLREVGGNNGNELDRRSAIIETMATSLAIPSIMLYPSNAIAKTNTIPNWTLENGVRMPTLALNTVGLTAEETERAIRLAKNEGITHVDFHPGKERDGVAQYITKEGQRTSLFLNTKIRKAPPGTSTSDAAKLARNQIDEDLKILGVKCVDMLMLRDSPDSGVIQAQWAVLEEALSSGKTRSIGVINFCESAIKSVLETAKIKPALNYYMLHVGMGKDAHGLRSFVESKGIRTFAYGAVGEPGPSEELLTSPILKRIGNNHQKSPEEVALRWVLQNGNAVSVRPTTNFGLGVSTCNDNACDKGIKSRAASFTWSLTAEEMKELDNLTLPDDNPTLFSSSGCPGAFVMPKK